MNIEIKDNIIPTRKELESLYSDVGWLAYTNNMDALVDGVNKSLDVITAWDNDKLVGLIRTIGDSQTIIYIQDILVLTSYHRKGIGSKLLQTVVKRYPNVRQMVLITDDDVNTKAFYEKNGLKSGSSSKTNTFLRFL